MRVYVRVVFLVVVFFSQVDGNSPLDKGLFYYQNQEYSKALKYFNISLNKNIAKYGSEHPNIAHIHTTIGYIQKRLHHLSKALKSFKKSSQIFEKQLGINHLQTSHSYDDLGNIYSEMENYSKALIYYKKSFQIRKQLLGNHNDTIIVCNKISNIYKKINNRESYLKSLMSELKIAKDLFGLNSKEVATLYNNIGIEYQYFGEYGKAFKSFQKTLNIRKTLKLNDKETANIYGNLCLLKNDTQQYAKALVYCKKAIKINKQHNQKKQLSILYNNLGLVYTNMQNHPESIKYYKKALKLKEKLFGKLSINTAKTYNNLGLYYQYIGNYKKSRFYYEKSLKIHQKTFEIEHIETATLYNNLAKNYRLSKDYSQALKNYLKAVKIFEKKLGISHQFTLTTYNNLGLLYQYQDDFLNAIKYYSKVESYIEKLPINQSLFYNSIGTLYLTIMNYKKAKYYLEKAQEVNKKNSYKSINTALTYNNLSHFYSNTNDFREAYSYALKAFDEVSQNRVLQFSLLSNDEKILYSKKYKDYMFQLLLASSKLSKLKYTQATFISWINYKRSIFDYENSLKELYRDSKKSVKKLISNYRNFQIQLSNEYKKQNVDMKKMKTIEYKLSDSEIKLNKHLNPYVSKDINISDVQKALKPNELYIDFASTDESYIYFIVSKDDIKMREINSFKNAIDNNITKVNEIMTKISKGRIFTNTSLIQKHLTSLHKAIMLDMNISKEIDTLIISPDGLLNLVPFEALYDGKKYLIEKYKISYIPSAKELVKLSNREQKPSKHIDIFASPDYDSRVSSSTRKLSARALKLGRFYALPYSKEEGKSIKTLLKSRYKTNLYMGKKANEKNLLNINSPKILHIATHGFYQANSNIANPMLKSGIVLSGANKSLKRGENFGIINALDLSRLNLKDTKLVTLSSCESGVGSIDEAEGVGSISKAFIKAGSSYVVMSLWSVSDEATAEFMQRFYSGVARGDDYAKYLRETKLKMIHDKDSLYTHPYFWASFVGSGR